MENDCILLHTNPSYPFQPPVSEPPVAHNQRELMAYLDRLKFFLATAPSRWSAPDVPPSSQHHPALNRFLLPSGEYVSCVLWSGLFHITGTDIVRALLFRFEAFGRPVRNMKKFEEGVFSDLRNLKPGPDACLEEPKSPFLDLLFKYQCIRTQKKQKVFYWFSVPHDRLFLDALERDLKREKMGLESTTAVVDEPALSFSYDPKRPLFEQFVAATHHTPMEPDQQGSLPTVFMVHTEPTPNASASSVSLPELDYPSARSSMDSQNSSLDCASVQTEPPIPSRAPLNPLARSPFFNMFSLFEGNPRYKQRRKKANKVRRGAGDEDRDSARYSLDSGRHSLDSGRHSLDGSRPITRSQPRNHVTFLAGPGQFGIARPVSGLPSFSRVGKPGKHMRTQRDQLPLTAPTLRHHCPLFTCPESFSDAESLGIHIHTHRDNTQGADNQQADMDTDKREVDDASAYRYAQCMHGTQELQRSPGSPEIPHFTHVLTTPDGSPGYDFEDEYTGSGEWTTQAAESPDYGGTADASVSSPGFIQTYAYDTSSAGSTRSSEAHSAPSSVTSNQPYYPANPAKHQNSVSASSGGPVKFDSYLPSAAPADPYIPRRPRSVAPSVPCRAPHARRPSTANEVPPSFGASQSSGYASSWQHRPASYAPRGYHPYAAPAYDHSYGTESSRSSPDSSSYAVSHNTPASEYPSEASHAGDYGSEASPQQMSALCHEYGAPPPRAQENPSPRLQNQFAHTVSTENVSPIEGLELTYCDPKPFDDAAGSNPNHGSYTGSPESVEHHHPLTPYQFLQGTTNTANTAVYAHGAGSSTDDDNAMYLLGQLVPAHSVQMHPHYYEQQVVA